ncbi:putative nuclease HARBI1 [Penaeus japonicus]|uniref:putative nuclease HARBI1 n=1 Tax=Penaeus japonicus TaxID=27405 RepID=UPI001C70B2AA|nr:putative nuclease HARBI1 [Penaeus japonicus]
MGDCHEMSQPTVSRCVRSVSVKIADLAVEYITFPQPAEGEVAMQQFSLIAGMPGVIGWPGSAHDARIFNESQLCQRLQGGHYRGFLLGDNGYPCRSYLLTPFLSPRSDKERNYNFSHIRTRNTIERAFGVLKRRFAVLSIPMRIALETSKKAIIACAVLHNIAVLYRVPFDDFVAMVPDDPPLIPVQDPRNNVQGGHARREQIVHNFF